MCLPNGFLPVESFHMSSVQFCLAFGIHTINNSWPRVTEAYWLIMEQNTCQRRLLIGSGPVREKWASQMMFCLQLGSEV